MDALDLDQATDEIIQRADPNVAALAAPNFPPRQSPSDVDDATAALALVSETAAAIRQLEQHSAQAVARAHNAANAVMEELERTEFAYNTPRWLCAKPRPKSPNFRRRPCRRTKILRRFNPVLRRGRQS